MDVAFFVFKIITNTKSHLLIFFFSFSLLFYVVAPLIVFSVFVFVFLTFMFPFLYNTCPLLIAITL